MVFASIGSNLGVTDGAGSIQIGWRNGIYNENMLYDYVNARIVPNNVCLVHLTCSTKGTGWGLCVLCVELSRKYILA